MAIDSALVPEIVRHNLLGIDSFRSLLGSRAVFLVEVRKFLALLREPL